MGDIYMPSSHAPTVGISAWYVVQSLIYGLLRAAYTYYAYIHLAISC